MQPRSLLLYYSSGWTALCWRQSRHEQRWFHCAEEFWLPYLASLKNANLVDGGIGQSARAVNQHQTMWCQQH